TLGATFRATLEKEIEAREIESMTKTIAEMTDLELLGCRFRLRPFALRLWPLCINPRLSRILVSHDDEWMVSRISDSAVRVSNLNTGHGVDVDLSDVLVVQWDAASNPWGLKYGTLRLRKRIWLRGAQAGLIAFKPIKDLRVEPRPVW